MMRFSKTIISQNYNFISQIDTKPWFRKKEVISGVSKTPKDYSFDKIMFLDTTRFVASKHLVAFKTKVFCKTTVFLQYFKNTLHPNRA